MKTYAVIGAGFGDEGKGLVTSHLCSQCKDPLVIRFSGGHQAGHQVILDDNRQHVFANFGSGTMQGVATYWSKYCTIDPIGMVNELDSLLDNGADPKIYIDAQCPVTTPYDMKQNRRTAKMNGHGTCGVGFGATIQRQADRYSLVFSDLFIPAVLAIKLDLIKSYYQDSVSLGHFVESCQHLVTAGNVMITDGFPEEKFETFIFEGSQGLLLDQRNGFFPHVTRSNTGSKNILEMGFAPHIFLVTRAYQVRHGNGPMTNEDLPHNIQENPYEKNYTNEFQGRFRRSLLDLDLLRYAIERDRYIRTVEEKTLVITCLDLIQNEYRFTMDHRIHYCCDENEFVQKVARNLNISNVLISKSPFTHALEPMQLVPGNRTPTIAGSFDDRLILQSGNAVTS
jgi:adenylosuccinate synthase